MNECPHCGQDLHLPMGVSKKMTTAKGLVALVLLAHDPYVHAPLAAFPTSKEWLAIVRKAREFDKK